MRVTSGDSSVPRGSATGQDGFTLVEVLIVIVVLAILAAIAVVAVQSMEGSSAQASCEYDVQTVDRAIQVYKLQMGAPPTVVQDRADGTAVGQLMPTAQLIGAEGTPVGPWLHNVPTNGKFYAITLASIGTSSYVEVTAPTGSPTPSNSVIYEPRSAVSGTPGLSSNTSMPVVNSVSNACGLVKSSS